MLERIVVTFFCLVACAEIIIPIVQFVRALTSN
jgi:hypothetical protein